MLSVSKINPMVRAVATMGAVAALVGGVTFADSPKGNTVTVGSNTVDVVNSLEIAPVPTGGCTAVTTSSWGTNVPGFDVTNLTANSTVSPVNFCLLNNSNNPLGVGGSIDKDVSAATVSGDITLAVSCTTAGSLSTSLSSWFTTAPTEFSGTKIDANTTDTCTANISLSNSYTGGAESVTPFNIVLQGES